MAEPAGTRATVDAGARRTPRHFRIFLSSPGDVAEERELARKLIKSRLPLDAFLRNRASFDVVSWDDPDSGTPMLGSLSPQECVNRFGPAPSACDIVIVVLWARMGTPLPAAWLKPDGERYRSGTEWEFVDAVNATPALDLLIYRRTEEPVVKLRDPDRAEKDRQFALVEDFFAGFNAADGSLLRSYTSYASAAAFAERLESDLKQLLRLQLEADDAKRALHLRELEETLAERERALSDREAAVDALLAEAKRPADAAGIETALKELAAGDATAAKQIFASVIDREAAEGRAALARAAEAARHLGTLAMLDNTLEALAAFRRAAEFDPTDTWTWIHICRLETQRGNLAAAAAAARRATQAAEAAGDERDVMVADNERGNVLVAQGDLAAALQCYRDAFATAHRLAQADPGNAGWQRDLSVAHNKIGDVLRDQGNLAQALDSYQADLAIAERLAQADPGNAGWQHDVALSLQRVGWIAAENGDRQGALQVWRRGLAIMQRLTALAPDHAAFSRDLAWFEDRIADLNS